MRLTASNIVRALQGLPKNCWFDYVDPSTKTQACVVSADGPEGPVRVKRRREKNGVVEVKDQTVSSQMIWRIANACEPGVPINFDRVLAASYNTRSLFEALLAHTPQFYWCKPGRIQLTNNTSKIEDGHKHLIWLPNAPHQNGVMVESPLGSSQAISEIPSQSVVYESLALSGVATTEQGIDIDVIRRHLQIQIALIMIGTSLGYRTWVAHNDKGFKYGERRVGELPGVVANLSEEKVLAAYTDAMAAANLIDCIWFKNGRLMPAVFEVEHSTGITSGLTRMKRFQDLGPHLAGVRWVIVAADEDRADVMKKAAIPHFASLQPRYFSYSAVEELYSLCKRRRLSGVAVNEGFLDCFMEPCQLPA